MLLTMLRPVLLWVRCIVQPALGCASAGRDCTLIITVLCLCKGLPQCTISILVVNLAACRVVSLNNLECEGAGGGGQRGNGPGEVGYPPKQNSMLVMMYSNPMNRNFGCIPPAGSL